MKTNVFLVVLANLAIAFTLPLDVIQKLPFLAEEQLSDIDRVVGGTRVVNGERPYQILLKNNGIFGCGGSLIGSRTVLTAAHCIYGKESNPRSFTVGVNTLTQSAGQSIQVSRIVRHPSYVSQNFDYDFAILHLASAFTPGTNAQIGQLVANGHDANNNDVVVVSGWGKTSGSGSVSQYLLKAELNVMARSTCGSRWGTTISTRMLCAYAASRSACNGDSGGPLTCGGQICGVVSWGSPQCQSYPNVYARVGAVRPWIDQNNIG